MATPTGSSHPFRTFFASLLGLAASWILVSGILVVWLNHTLTDTKAFTTVLAPLSQNTAIQDYLTDTATDAIVHGSSSQEAAAQILPGQDFSTSDTEQIASALRPVVSQNVSSIVRSDTFSSLWQQTITDIHASMKKQLESDREQIRLDFSPAVKAIIDQLRSGALAPLVDTADIDASKAKLTIESNSLENIRRAYKLFKAASLAWIILGLACAAGAIALSVDHMRTFRRVAILTGSGSLLIALSIYMATKALGQTSNVGGKATQALLGTLLHDVQRTSIIIGVTCIMVALISKLLSFIRARQNKATPATKAGVAAKPTVNSK